MSPEVTTTPDLWDHVQFLKDAGERNEAVLDLRRLLGRSCLMLTPMIHLLHVQSHRLRLPNRIPDP